MELQLDYFNDMPLANEMLSSCKLKKKKGYMNSFWLHKIPLMWQRKAHKFLLEQYSAMCLHTDLKFTRITAPF